MSLQAIFGQAIGNGLTAYVKPGADSGDDATMKNLLSMMGFKPADGSPKAFTDAVTQAQKSLFPDDPSEWDGKAGPKTLLGMQARVNAHMLAPNPDEQATYRINPAVQAFLGLTRPPPNLNAPAPAGSVRPKSNDPKVVRMQLDGANPMVQTDAVNRLLGIQAASSGPRTRPVQVSVDLPGPFHGPQEL
jgi:hypothetical protein